MMEGKRVSAKKWFSMIRGGRGGQPESDFRWSGGRGVSQKVISDDQRGGESRPPPKKHDIINEQPHIRKQKQKLWKFQNVWKISF